MEATKSIGKFATSRNLRGAATLVGRNQKFTCVMVEADTGRQACSKLIRGLRSAHTERLNMKLIDLLARGRKQHPDEAGSPMPVAHDRTDRSSMADLVRLLQEHDEAQSAMTQARHGPPDGAKREVMRRRSR